MTTRTIRNSALAYGTSLVATVSTLIVTSCGGGGKESGQESASPRNGGAAGQSAGPNGGISTRAVGSAGAAGAAGRASCTPTGADDPDDAFADTDCDGIDGDKTKAIFVGPSGNDSAPGTIEEPVRSLAKAVE